MVDIDLESVARLNDYLKNREFIISFRHDESKWIEFLKLMDRYDMRWRSTMILIKYEPAGLSNGGIFIKDSRKRTVASMSVEALNAKAFSYGHSFDAVAVPDIYKELTGLKMTKVRFRIPNQKSFFSRGENLNERDF